MTQNEHVGPLDFQLVDCDLKEHLMSKLSWAKRRDASLYYDEKAMSTVLIRNIWTHSMCKGVNIDQGPRLQCSLKSNTTCPLVMY